jgi:anaerobic magnesium-protoporphyrin IX monomethyl ester cyclase
MRSVDTSNAAVAYANASQYTFHDGRILDTLDLMNHLSFGPDWEQSALKRGRYLPSQMAASSCNVAFLTTFLQRRGFDVRVVENVQLETALLNSELDGDEDIVAAVISTTHIHSFNHLGRVCRQIKARRPKLPIVAGGILLRHFNELLTKGADAQASWINYHEAMEPSEEIQAVLQSLDYVVSDLRGEQTLVRFLQALADGTDVSTVPNLTILSPSGKIAFTKTEPEQRDEVLYEPIAWNELPYTPHKVIYTISSRGCPWRCRFCVLYESYPKMLFKPLEVWKAELKSLRYCRDVSFAWLIDIEPLVGRKRTHDLLDAITQYNPGIQWGVGTRADTIDEDVARKMRDANVKLVYMGLESGDQGQLDRMNKRMSLKDSRNAIELLHKYGIAVSTSWVIGYPGETDETLDNTVKLIDESRALYHLSVLHYHSGLSELAKVKAELGIEGLGSPTWWRHRTMDSVGAAKSVLRIQSQVKHAVNEGSDSLIIMSYLLAAGFTPSQAYEVFRLGKQLSAINRGTGTGPAAPVVAQLKEHAQRVTWGA